jgi:hypothetical protein
VRPSEQRLAQPDGRWKQARAASLVAIDVGEKPETDISPDRPKRTGPDRRPCAGREETGKADGLGEACAVRRHWRHSMLRTRNLRSIPTVILDACQVPCRHARTTSPDSLTLSSHSRRSGPTSRSRHRTVVKSNDPRKPTRWVGSCVSACQHVYWHDLSLIPREYDAAFHCLV